MIRRFFDERERGAALAWFTISVVLLIGAAGFAVDLGWMYLNASRVQRTVDSAALAGVVHLPGFPNSADLDARDAARANGFDVCDPGILGCSDILTSTPLTDHKLQVELETEIDALFTKVLGFDSFGITREATAEYVKPVPLGSPDRCFGQDPTGTFCTADPTDFWAAVSGPYTRKHDGDPYSTHCVDNSTASSCAQNNPDYARGGTYNGYYYGIEVFDASQPLEVWIYDARFDERNNYPNVETADARFAGSGNNGVTTSYSLHGPDPTPQDPTDNPAVSCNSGPGAATLSPDLYPSGSAQKNTWARLCRINNPTLGIYVLHVRSAGSNGSGSNQFSVAAAQSGASTQPRVYGINDMSIFSNKLTPGNPSKLYLVEVAAEHAGSKLELQFFDAGDASGESYMRVKDPFDNIPNCDYDVTDHDQSTVLGSGSGSCEWLTTTSGGTRIYNNQWIIAVIDIPASYTCNGSDCFWYMELELSQPNERTTWRARVIGNPVRLVP